MTTPSRHEILDKLNTAVHQASNGRVKLERLDANARIIEDLGLASLDLLELRYELEELWQITIENSELAQLHTVSDVVRLVEKHLAS